MKADQVTLLINTAFSIVELVAKLRRENPDLFINQEAKIKQLRLMLTDLENKSDDYLQNWDGEE